jgi:hypothetical protein
MPPAAAIAPRWPIPRRYRKHGRARAGTTSSLVHPRERRPFHQLENERANAICVLDSIDRGDVRVIQRRENLPLPLEALQTRFILREGLGKNLDRDFALQLPVRGLYTSPIPPAPSAPRISYEPRRVPAVRLMRFGSSAGEKDSVRGEAGPQCAPGQPSPGLFSTLEAPSRVCAHYRADEERSFFRSFFRIPRLRVTSPPTAIASSNLSHVDP